MVNYYNITLQFLQYNVPHGKLARATYVRNTFKSFAKPEDITPENMKLVYILGWIVEMVSASYIETKIDKMGKNKV